MNRWHIYEILKNNVIPDKSTIRKIENMDPEEIKEGLIEWLILRDRQKGVKM